MTRPRQLFFAAAGVYTIIMRFLKATPPNVTADSGGSFSPDFLADLCSIAVMLQWGIERNIGQDLRHFHFGDAVAAMQ